LFDPVCQSSGGSCSPGSDGNSVSTSFDDRAPGQHNRFGEAQPFYNAVGSYTINGPPAVVSRFKENALADRPSIAKMKPRIGVLTSGAIAPDLTRSARRVLAAENLGGKWLVFVTDSKDFFLPAIMLFSIAKALTDHGAGRHDHRHDESRHFVAKSVLAIGRLCLRTSLQAQEDTG